MKKILLVLPILFVLVGCNEKEDIKDVDYYRSHVQERQEKIKECRSSAEKSLTINCENALKADRLAEASKTGGIKLD